MSPELKDEALLEAEQSNFEDCMHRFWHHRSVANAKHDVGRAMLSVWIPALSGQEYLSDLNAALDDDSR